MEDSNTEQAADFLEEKKHKTSLRLYGKIFLSVFSVAVLWQGMLLVDNYASRYTAETSRSFKMLLVSGEKTAQEELNNLSEKLQQREEITDVRIFNSQEALAQVRRQNPQLVETLLLLGTHKMPAYLEVRLTDKGIVNAKVTADNLSALYPQFKVRYNGEHAGLIANAVLFCKILRLLEFISLLALVVFMFLVEAAPYRCVGAGAGFLSGLLATLGACGVVWGVLYLTGHLPEIWDHLICAKEQAVLLVMGSLLGWTFSKWQKF